MEIGPIFRALYHNKARFWLITLEVALTLAVVANCLNVILDFRAKAQRPTGMDVANILVLESQPFAAEFNDETYVHAAFEEDLRRLRAFPGVRAAAAMHQIPLSGSGSATGRRPQGSDEESSTAPYFVVSNGVVESLGVELVAGRDFVDSDFPEAAEEGLPEEDNQRERNVILTQALADRLFPEGDALGKQITPREGPEVNTVVGIVGHMHGSWPLSSVADRVMLLPGQPASKRRARYVVRTESGMLDELYTSLEKELLRIDEGRIVHVHTLQEIKDDFYGDLAAVNKMFGAMGFLLLLVTSLGIIGMTSFSVGQRTKQIGTRRALGATRGAILRYFLVENWVITGVGLVLGIGLTYGLNYLMANLADVPRIGWPLIASGMLLLWLVGLAAALVPALRGTWVQPVVATQNV